uniref:Uncharacterized protein n=1 Tax=Naja naja TaxID=35670 RepID=A0A8C6YDV0_NAJNA
VRTLGHIWTKIRHSQGQSLREKFNHLITLPWVPQPSPLQDVPPTWSGLSPTSPTASQMLQLLGTHWPRFSFSPTTLEQSGTEHTQKCRNGGRL